MLNKLFWRNDKASGESTSELAVEVDPKATSPGIIRVSIEEQRLQQQVRKQLVIDEFGKSVINLRLQKGILTPLHIVDLHKIELRRSPQQNVSELIKQRITESLEIHKHNLRHRLYRESFNLQPGHLLLVVKDIRRKQVVSFKGDGKNMGSFLQGFNARAHDLMLVRYFVPPIPDDMYIFDHIQLPAKFEQALTELINYCYLNYSLDNLPLDKWESLIMALDNMGVTLSLVNKQEEIPFRDLLIRDYSDIGYRKLVAKLLLRENVEKRTVVIPLFVILLGFFCSSFDERTSFPYHFLFTATGDAKLRSLEKGKVSFFKQFNQLLDEGLTSDQFVKCISVLYNEAFHAHKVMIDDLFFAYRDRHVPRSNLAAR